MSDLIGTSNEALDERHRVTPANKGLKSIVG